MEQHRLVEYRRVVINAAYGRWNVCVLILLTTVILETIFILCTGIHLYYTPQHGQASSTDIFNSSSLTASTSPSSATKTPSTPPPSHRHNNRTPQEFLEQYERYCNRTFMGVRDSLLNPSAQKLPLCPCVPTGLNGHENVTFDVPPVGEMELLHAELAPGGVWQPTNCTARQRVAIVVPFRDREEHLRVFLHRLHPMLQRQQLAYRIVVVEQWKPDVFNKAMMMNIGFKEAGYLDDYSCFIFHDVDMLPEDDRNMYTCSPLPRHVGSHCDKWQYTVPYPELFGGATAFIGEHFIRVNGFSNLFYGWGGEDDDMYRRIRAKRLKIVRYPGSIARYTMIKHKSDRRNPYNRNSGEAWGYRPEHYAKEGLNTLSYRRTNIEFRPLYTWILAEVPAPVKFNRRRSRGLAHRSAAYMPLVVLMAAICMTYLHNR